MKHPFKRTEQQQKEKKAPSLILALVLAVVFVFLLSSVISLVRKQQRIKVTIKELQTQQVALVEKQEKLTQTIDYLETDEGKEQVLRDKFRLVKPGEGLIVITDPLPATDSGTKDKTNFFQRFFNAIKRVFTKEE